MLLFRRMPGPAADPQGAERLEQLVEELASERGKGDNEAFEYASGRDRTYLAKIRKRKSVGPQTKAEIEARLGISSSYWTGTGSFRRYTADRRDDSVEWERFAELNADSLTQLGTEATGWIRRAPFRGGMPDQSAGWALALNTAMSLRRLATDPKAHVSEPARPKATKLMGRK